MVNKILNTAGFILIFGLIVYLGISIKNRDDISDKRFQEFVKRQETYEKKMDSLKAISESLMLDIMIMSDKVSSSKKALDDLKKNPPIANLTNEELEYFFKNIAFKYGNIIGGR